jgi:hypothetical protein
MTPRAYIYKVIRTRKAIMRRGASQLNAMACLLAIQKLEAWLSAYPNASPQQVRAYMMRHRATIEFLIPGNLAGESLKKELCSLLGENVPRPGVAA